MAYVLGFFAADGSMLKNKRGACFIEFNITDKRLLYSIRKMLGSNHMISERKRGLIWKPIYRLQIGSKDMFKDLSSLGFTQNKSKSLKFPDVPINFLPDFIKGYFDGDGNVYFKKHFSKSKGKMVWVFTSRFTSGSKGFLQTLHHLLREHGNIKGGFIQSKKRGEELVFSRHDSLALYCYMYNNGNCPIHLGRKKKIFEKAFRVLGYSSIQ